MNRDVAAIPVCDLPKDRLEALGRKPARRKPEGGPVELTGRHKLLVTYMVDGCGHQSICDRIWVDRPVTVEGGTAMLKRHPNPHEPLSLLEAADLLRIRRRNARELSGFPIFKKHLEEELRRYRDGERVASVRTLVEVRDDPGLGKAADRKVRMQASMALLGELGGDTNVTVAVGVGMQIMPGYILDLEERDEEAPQTIEHRSA